MDFSALDLIPRHIFTGIFALLGLFIGSFLNVCIMRAAKGESIAWPPSHCDACGSRLRPWELIPVLSWICLRGRCPRCGARISAWHPFVELLTSGLFALLAWKFGPTPQFAVYLVFTCVFLVESGIDFRIMILPDLLTLGGAALALPCALWLGMPWGQSLAGGLAAAGVFWALMIAFEKIKGIEGMGFGDVKLMLGIGFLCGIMYLPAAVLISSISALCYMVPAAFRSGGDLRTMRVPFGPFLCLGGWITMIWGADIFRWWLGIVL